MAASRNTLIRKVFVGPPFSAESAFSRMIVSCAPQIMDCPQQQVATPYIQNPHFPLAITYSDSARFVTPCAIMRSPSDRVRLIHQL